MDKEEVAAFVACGVPVGCDSCHGVGDDLSWQKILVAPNYWFLQAIVVYYALFYCVGRLIAIRGGVYMDPLRYQRIRFGSQCFFVSTRSWLDVSHSLALCVPFQRDGHGGYGVHVSGED